jgi:hypothetical protein
VAFVIREVERSIPMRTSELREADESVASRTEARGPALE